MVNGLLLAAAWAAAARIPICMLSLERTDDDMLVGCLLARLIPSRSCCFSSLKTYITKNKEKGIVSVESTMKTRKKEVSSLMSFFRENFKGIDSEAVMYSCTLQK